jgi:signal peptidase I
VTGSSAAPASAAAALAKELLSGFGRLNLRVTGTSMLPALRPGDVIEFDARGSTQAEPGDVVLYRRDESLVVHRVLARDNDCLITQGDSLAAPDATVPLADVLGRAVVLNRGNRIVAGCQLFRPGPPITRWWFRRFDLATRLLLRWDRITARIAA